MTIARELAEFLTRVAVADLPPQTLDYATMLIASTIASAACGAGLDSAAIIRDMARERGGTAEAGIWFDRGPRLPAADAAQVNAVMSDAAASDDSDLRAIVHCGTPLVTTTLALAERTGAGGGDVLAAIVLGYEAAGRIGEAITPGFRTQGFHGCLVAIFAAAVAAGCILRLDAPQMAQAIALSATSIGGLATAADTSVAREYHAGLAVNLGIQAASAARRGYRCEERILETPRGFFEVYGAIDPVTAAEIAMRDLGSSWDIVTDMAVKLVPGGHPYHALAEAAAEAARDGDIAADEIDSITLSRPGFTTLTPPLHPTDLIGMAHSPAYFLAAGAADRDFSWENATPAKIADPVIHRLIDKVGVGAPPTENIARYRQGATVTVRAKDGRTCTRTVYEPRGSGSLGISWSVIDAKYRTLVPNAPLTEESIAASLAVIHEFRDVTRVSDLTDLLRA